MISKEEQLKNINETIQKLATQIDTLTLWRRNIIELSDEQFSLISNEINEKFICAIPIPFYKKISMLFIDTILYTKEIKE